MYQINNEKFGHFLAEVRKEKQMTQKDLLSESIWLKEQSLWEQ